MAKILLIDDDRIIRKMVSGSLSALGYEVVSVASGEEGLQRVKEIRPDVIVTDKMMPGIDGFEVTRRLRREPGFVNTPIIVLTSESDLDDKLGAFEAGADDYISKPFEQAELAARITALLRRSEALKAAQSQAAELTEQACTFAVHTLRGGIGCSSVAVNLAIALHQLWEGQNIILDLNMIAGQLSLMLNTPLRKTWASVGDVEPDDIDIGTIVNIVTKHTTGVHMIAAPSDPITAEQVAPQMISRMIRLMSPRYQYMVADLPHDFSSLSLEMLDIADTIFLVLAPDMASIRSASAALSVYSELGYGPEKVKLILNNTFEHGALPTKKIEAALKHPISLEIPFAPRQFISGINRGIPIVQSDADDPISIRFEDFAFKQSKEQHRQIPPANPSQTWHRVNQRINSLEAHTQKKSRSRSIFAL